MSEVAVQTSELWSSLRQRTQARIGLGRAGSALPTRHRLELQAAHAAARRTALALPDDPDEAVVQARAFRLLDESWWRLVDRHDRDRQARRASEADAGLARPSPDTVRRPSAVPEPRARGDVTGMDGP